MTRSRALRRGPPEASGRAPLGYEPPRRYDLLEEVSLLRLGPALLTALLLGVPRALGGRAFGARAVFVEVAEDDPALDAFGEALSRAVRRSGARLVGAPVGPAAVITVHGLYRAPNGDEAVTLSVGSARRIVVQHPPGQRDEAARALLERLCEDDAPSNRRGIPRGRAAAHGC